MRRVVISNENLGKARQICESKGIDLPVKEGEDNVIYTDRDEDLKDIASKIMTPMNE